MPEKTSRWIPGAVVPSQIQRQSGDVGSSTHTGFPSAPAKCATLVSTEITRSKFAMIAACIGEVRDLVIESQNLADILQRRIVQGADFLLETDERRVDLEKRF